MNIKNLRQQSYYGSVLVEFALILPVLILLILGMIELSWMIYAKQTLAAAAREGARALAVREATHQETEDLVKNYIENFSVNTTDIIIDITDVDPNCNTPPSNVALELKLPMENISLTFNLFNWFDVDWKIKAKVVMRKECSS